MPGPRIHYIASCLLSKELFKLGIEYKHGNIIDNIVPDFEVSHGFDYPTMQGNLLTIIDKEISALSSWYKEHNSFNDLHIRFLLHYLVDSCSIGQIDSRFWVRHYGFNKDDCIDFLSEFTNKIPQQIYFSSIDNIIWDDIKYYIYRNIRNTAICYEKLLTKLDFSEIKEMTRTAIAESVWLVYVILNKIKE